MSAHRHPHQLHRRAKELVIITFQRPGEATGCYGTVAPRLGPSYHQYEKFFAKRLRNLREVGIRGVTFAKSFGRAESHNVTSMHYPS